MLRLSTKSAETIEQKGVAQLLQIEEVRLSSSQRYSFSQSPHAQEASIILVFYTQFKTHFVTEALFVACNLIPSTIEEIFMESFFSLIIQ